MNHTSYTAQPLLVTYACRHATLRGGALSALNTVFVRRDEAPNLELANLELAPISNKRSYKHPPSWVNKY